MSEQKENDEAAQIHYEDGLPILEVGRQLSEIERRQAESDRREAEYKGRQIALTTWQIIVTSALAITTIALGGVQSCYMHRQWKLTSEGLSRAGDQIWAAKDAAYASQKASTTAAQALADSEVSFNKTLLQMKQQTEAALESNSITKESLVSVQRAFVFFQHVDTGKMYDSAQPRRVTSLEFVFSLGNSGTTPTKFLHITTNYYWQPDPLPADFGFPDLTKEPPVPGSIGPKGVATTKIYYIPAPVIQGVKDHTLHLYFWGWASYHDIFKGTQEHITKFCTEITGFDGDPLDPDQSTTYRLVLENCKRNNCYDEECKDN